MAAAWRGHPIRKWSGFALIAAAIGWTLFVLATFGSAEDRYFRDCTGSCLPETPDSYRFNHALLEIFVVAVPVALVAGAWLLFDWLFSHPDA